MIRTEKQYQFLYSKYLKCPILWETNQNTTTFQASTTNQKSPNNSPSFKETSVPPVVEDVVVDLDDSHDVHENRNETNSSGGGEKECSINDYASKDKIDEEVDSEEIVELTLEEEMENCVILDMEWLDAIQEQHATFENPTEKGTLKKSWPLMWIMIGKLTLQWEE